MSADAELPR